MTIPLWTICSFMTHKCTDGRPDFHRHILYGYQKPEEVGQRTDSIRSAGTDREDNVREAVSSIVVPVDPANYRVTPDYFFLFQDYFFIVFFGALFFKNFEPPSAKFKRSVPKLKYISCFSLSTRPKPASDRWCKIHNSPVWGWRSYVVHFHMR